MDTTIDVTDADEVLIGNDVIDDAPVEPATDRPGVRRDVVGPCLLAAALSTLIAISGVRGADYPAHELRALLWEQTGASVWSFHWYAGHPTPQYSVVAPMLTAVLGAFGVAALSSVAATYWFSRLTCALVGTPATTLANHAFAVAVTINVVVGRVAFALGLALALGALWTWHRRRLPAALALAVLTPVASPVAAVFLAIAASAVAIDDVRQRRSCGQVVRSAPWSALAVSFAATAPVAITTVLFHEPGRFPFLPGGFVASSVVLLVLAVVARSSVVRTAVALAGVALVVAFLVPNPLGGSFSRLTQIVAVPLVLSTAWSPTRGPRRAVVVAGIAAVLWSVMPGVGAFVEARGDRSADPDFHRPLVEQVRARNLDGRPVGRLEIPFTENHWESFFVAPRVPYARGWERQVDLVRNPELYEPSLTLDEYHRWLRHNAVRWIAVPAVALDEGGIVEAGLVARERIAALDIPWLRPVWGDRDWRLYEVVDYRPIVDPPAVLVEQRPDTVVIETARPAVVSVRYRFTDHLTISGAACVERGDDGWILAHLPTAGVFEIGVDPAASWRRPAGGSCR